MQVLKSDKIYSCPKIRILFLGNWLIVKSLHVDRKFYDPVSEGCVFFEEHVSKQPQEIAAASKAG